VACQAERKETKNVLMSQLDDIVYILSVLLTGEDYLEKLAPALVHFWLGWVCFSLAPI
jgi:hypothetical protein